jgi:DNA-binding CsgD family transcriptional regulator
MHRYTAERIKKDAALARLTAMMPRTSETEAPHPLAVRWMREPWSAELEQCIATASGETVADAAGPNGETIHAAGGTPETDVPAAPAPRHERLLWYRALRPKAPAGMATLDDALSRCRAAARLTLTGDQWDAEHAADCTSHLVMHVLESGSVRQTRQGPMVPLDSLQHTRLLNLASNWRRTQERDAMRDQEHAAVTARATGLVGHVEADLSALRAGSKRAAVERAVTLMQNARMPLKWGPDFTLAYTLARTVTDGLESREVAAELGLTAATQKQHVSRALKRYGGKVAQVAAKLDLDDRAAMAALAYTLAMPDGGTANTEAAPLNASTRDMAGLRVKPAQVAPVRERSNRRETGAPRKRPAQWAQELERTRPRAAARLAMAAQVKRERASKRTAEERQSARLAAGLTAPVR